MCLETLVTVSLYLISVLGFCAEDHSGKKDTVNWRRGIMDGALLKDKDMLACRLPLLYPA